MRRALRRAEDGKSLDATEAEILLQARGDDLDGCGSRRPGARCRADGARPPGHRDLQPEGLHPADPAVPGSLPLLHVRDHAGPAARAVPLARRGGRDRAPGCRAGCKEALFTLGDRPEDRWAPAREWLDALGFDSTLGYVRAMAIRVLEETGLLPHLNPGVHVLGGPAATQAGRAVDGHDARDHRRTSRRHRGSPDKVPAVRLRMIEDAGRSNMAFTTGMLVGIGETPADRVESLFALRALATAVRPHPGGHHPELPRQARHRDASAATTSTWRPTSPTVAVARLVLGPQVRVQAPPNLVDLEECRRLLAAGVDDWGGVSPVTPDHVNPERPWPHLDELARVSAESGYELPSG